jgi:hypothetical protein
MIFTALFMGKSFEFGDLVLWSCNEDLRKVRIKKETFRNEGRELVVIRGEETTRIYRGRGRIRISSGKMVINANYSERGRYTLGKVVGLPDREAI